MSKPTERILPGTRLVRHEKLEHTPARDSQRGAYDANQDTKSLG